MLNVKDMEAEVRGLTDARDEMQKRLQSVQAELARLDEELRVNAPLVEADESLKDHFHQIYESRARKRREQETLESAIQGLEREISARTFQLEELREGAGRA